MLDVGCGAVREYKVETLYSSTKEQGTWLLCAHRFGWVPGAVHCSAKHMFQNGASLFQAPRHGETSFRKKVSKEMQKREGFGERRRSFPSRARLIFVLLVLIRPHYTIWEPGTG